MATANFKVKNGLTVGNLSLTASTGNISSNVGNITLYPVAGSHVVVTGNLFLNGTDISAAINTVSNAVSVVSAAVASVETHVNTVSNAVSVVSVATLSVWNAVSAIKTSSQTFSGATYSYTGGIASSSTITGTIVVTGGVGVSGAIRAGSLYTDSYYYANGVAFSGGSAVSSNVENILYSPLGVSQIQIDYTTATGIGTVTYLATAKDNVNNNYKSSRITILSDGTTTYLTEFDTVYSNVSAEVVSYSSDILSGNIRLLATGDSANVSVQMQKVKLGTTITAGTVPGIVPVTIENFSPFMLMGA